jgi:hypothetical protein
MRRTELEERPTAVAIARDVQRTAFAGFVESVLCTTSSTSAFATRRGVPDRGSSLNPAIRLTRNRFRHLPTVGCETPSSLATWEFVCDPAHAKMIATRSDSCRETVRRRAMDSSADNSALLRSSGCRELLGFILNYRRSFNWMQRTSASSRTADRWMRSYRADRPLVLSSCRIHSISRSHFVILDYASLEST